MHLKSRQNVLSLIKMESRQKPVREKLKNYFLDIRKKRYALGTNFRDTSGRKNGGCKSSGWSRKKFNTSE